LVDAPAANPTGLFSAKVDSEESSMDEKQFAAAFEAAMAPYMEKMSAFEAFMKDAQDKLATIVVEDEEKEESSEEEMMDPAKDEQKEDMSAKLAAEVAELKALVSNFGAKPVAPAVAPEAAAKTVTEPTTFSEALEVVKAEGLTGSAATKAVIARYPDLYLAARNTGIRTL
jgi:hypothetical protein